MAVEKQSALVLPANHLEKALLVITWAQNIVESLLSGCSFIDSQCGCCQLPLVDQCSHARQPILVALRGDNSRFPRHGVS